ncbi:MAG: ribbon-helix-helix domain-containing protein [Hyphomicrobiales bacterium]|jgi:predicted DNA-binding ribbon-helix-helix protein|nr:ribbon-helix-helix domain-containing protein [Hyphomicrobiales bacterium]
MTDRPRGARRDLAIGRAQRAGVVKRSISIAGHATSVSLEEPFWQALKQLGDDRGLSVAGLVAEIDGQRGHSNLSSALRVAVLDHLTKQTIRRAD